MFMGSRRRRITDLLLFIGIAAAGCQSPEKPYLRNPLVKESNVMKGPAPEQERSTQVEPYPPPRPYFPDEPSNVAALDSILKGESQAR
jgi:hypothetical protein